MFFKILITYACMSLNFVSSFVDTCAKFRSFHVHLTFFFVSIHLYSASASRCRFHLLLFVCVVQLITQMEL